MLLLLLLLGHTCAHLSPMWVHPLMRLLLRAARRRFLCQNGTHRSLYWSKVPGKPAGIKPNTMKGRWVQAGGVGWFWGPGGEVERRWGEGGGQGGGKGGEFWVWGASLGSLPHLPMALERCNLRLQPIALLH